MSKKVTYGKYTIKSFSRPMEGGGWTLYIDISWEQDAGVNTRQFSKESTCQNEEEADIQGINYGQRIIDGKVPGSTVN